MDEALFARLKAGDPSARTPVRNQVRSLAARVLSAPQWRITDQTARAEMERAAANDALASRAESAMELTVEAMALAAGSGLRWLRSRDNVRGEHPDPDLMARVALETASAAQAMRLNQHLEECPSCKAHMQAGRAALRLAASAKLSVPPPAAPAPTPAAPTPAARAPKPTPKKRAKPSAPRRRASKKKKKDAPKLWPAVVVVALVGAAVAWKVQPSAEERIWMAAAVLPDELPPTDHARDYPGDVGDTIAGMSKGQCEAAAARLRVETRKAPNDMYLAYYQGLANVCVRNGPEAVAALSKVDHMGSDLPWGFEWWWAQALVLNGDTEGALDTLDTLAASSHGRSKDAAQLAADLRAVR